SCLLINARQNYWLDRRLLCPPIGYFFRWCFRCWARWRRNSFRLISEILFQVVLQLIVVLDPTTDFRHLLFRHNSAGSATWAQGDRQVPDRPVSLSFCTFAGGIPTSDFRAPRQTAAAARISRTFAVEAEYRSSNDQNRPFQANPNHGCDQTPARGFSRRMEL